MKLYFALIPAGLLASCTPYTTEFRCPIGQGMSCRSMSQVHEAVQSGAIADQADNGVKSHQLYFPPQSFRSGRG